uniref:Uncharacterized protein n=1 Tax=Paramoeba aestuarina TaxID=180227 RepID=A0A7S4NYU8_9EUKA|mmetsp:Transcript_32592/g.50968  ORF Transcript_32592/g.50968 Transcript_32592/m.50968 type:complete len:242 (+) Transcript_32592:61-786(+)
MNRISRKKSEMTEKYCHTDKYVRPKHMPHPSCVRSTSRTFPQIQLLNARVRKASTQIGKYIRKCITFCEEYNARKNVYFEQSHKNYCPVSLGISSPTNSSIGRSGEMSPTFDIDNGEVCANASEGALENASAANGVVQCRPIFSQGQTDRIISRSQDIPIRNVVSRENCEHSSGNVFLKLHIMQNANKDKARLHEELGVCMHACHSYLSRLHARRSLLSDTLIHDKQLYDVFQEQSLFVPE